MVGEVATDAPAAPGKPEGCECGVGRQSNQRPLGLPHGIDAGPVLDTPVGVRHLAKLDNDRYRTLCDRLVPEYHRCPTEAELRAQGVYTLLSCTGCHQVYLIGPVVQRKPSRRPGTV